jgi:hypothetical protein
LFYSPWFSGGIFFALDAKKIPNFEPKTAPPMPTILVTGGTGMIGTALSRMLISKGHKVILLSRNTSHSIPEGAGIAHWDPYKGSIDLEAVRTADFIIHLAGAGVADKRWSAKRKKEIVESRTRSSELLVKTLKETSNKVQAVISASGIGWYGPDPSIPNPRPFVESDPVDEDFLGETCRLWESSITSVTAMDKRLVIFRIGPVLSNTGGALSEFKKPVKLGVAAVLGSGRQVMSWIHVEDLCRLFLYAIEDSALSGVYNAVAPQPVDNRTLTLELARRMKGRYFVPVYVPSFILKILVGELSIEVLKSATVSAKKTRQTGFQFLYPSVQSALDDLMRRSG